MNGVKAKDLRTPVTQPCFSTCVIGGYISWAAFPRQRILKRISHVEQAPCYDDIVVKSHIEADLKEKESVSLVHDIIEVKETFVIVEPKTDSLER